MFAGDRFISSTSDDYNYNTSATADTTAHTTNGSMSNFGFVIYEPEYMYDEVIHAKEAPGPKYYHPEDWDFRFNIPYVNKHYSHTDRKQISYCKQIYNHMFKNKSFVRKMTLYELLIVTIYKLFVEYFILTGDLFNLMEEEEEF